jgi:hypothetical protein
MAMSSGLLSKVFRISANSTHEFRAKSKTGYSSSAKGFIINAGLSLTRFTSFVLLVLSFATITNAQVGIGTLTPDASAKLQVDATTQGFLPPRVALTSTAAASNAIASPATGLLVYNTATAGTSPSNVTPGFYYYDGSKWQRIINQQPDATVSFNSTNPNTGSPTFTPNTPSSTDYIYVGSDASQWTYNGSAYVTYTPPASTAWMLSGNTTDAGSNKSGSVFRTGSVAIGGQTTSPVTTVASSAQLEVISTSKGFLPPRMTSAQRNAISSPATGLLVFDTDLGELYIYSGSAWNPLVPKASTKIFQVFSKSSDQTLSSTPGDVTWSSVAGQGTALSFSSATITLPANKTFLITGYLAIATASGSLWATYQIQDNNNSTSDFVLSTRGFIESSTETFNDSPAGPAVAMINTGSSSKQIKLRVLSKETGTLQTTSNSNAYAETILLVQEL